MSTYADLGAAEAAAVLAEAQAIGQQVNLWHDGGVSATLYAVVNDLSVSSEKSPLGRRVTVAGIELIIANQTGFVAEITATAKPVQKGDKIEMPASSGRYFFVDEAMPLKANGFIWYVKAEERQTKAIGTGV